MRLTRPVLVIALGLVAGLRLLPASAGEAPAAPTSEEAQAAYARFATALVGRLIAAGLPTTITGGRFAEINEFAYRQALRGCDERREPDPDPFAPADAPSPPVVFHCTWESGERISLTRIANTGSWMVSDDAAAAAGTGLLLAGPRQEAPQVVAVPTVPLKASAPEKEEVPAVTTAVEHASPPVVYSGANLHAMPSPYVPPARAEPPRMSSPGPASPGPMPTPFAGAAR